MQLPLQPFNESRLVLAGQVRYWLLLGIVAVLMATHAVNGKWYGDFWEHQAVISELKEHPWSPVNPMISSEAPHSFFSPYSLAVALFAKLFDLSPVNALAIAGIGNLLLLAFSFLLFIREYRGKDQSYTIAFYGLLMILFLWGQGVWYWSGFFHIGVLGYVLPYPSAFAMGLAFLSMALLLRFYKNKKKISFILVILFLAVALLVHPNTALAMLVFLLCIVISSEEKLITKIGQFGLICTSAFLLAFAWPYYSFYTLIFSQSSDFHSDSIILYTDVLSRVWPGLLGVPFAAWILWKRRRDVIGLSFLLLTAIYIYGYLSGKYGYGRAISHAMIMLQVALAVGLANWEKALISFKKRSGLIAMCLFTVVSTYVLVFKVNSDHKYVLKDMVKLQTPSFLKYSFLGKHTERYDVIITDPATGWIVPAWGGKIVASIHPLPFVRDHKSRRKDMEAFFSSRTGRQERIHLIRKYKADYILVNRTSTSKEQTDSLLPLGNLAYMDSIYSLIKLEK